MQDWCEIENPTLGEIRLVAGIPGAKFTNDAAGNVKTIRLHRSLWPLAGFDYFTHSEVPTIAACILRDYQLADLPYLLNRRSSILGYEMRLGKTTTATCAHDPVSGPLLVIAPLIARDVWSYWIEKIHGFRPVCLESRQDIALPGFPAYFVHYDVLDAHSAFLQTLHPATFILDEIHMLQARRSLRMSTCSLIAANAQRIIGLSGTPMWSTPRSLWPILNLLAPGAWGTEFDFCQRYMRGARGAWGWSYQGTANEDELKQRLAEVVIRRTWKDVAPQLPPTINVVEYVEVNALERSRLELAAERARLATGNVRNFESGVAHLASLRKRYGLLKTKRAVELIADATRNKHKVVVWTWHTEVAAELLHACHNICLPVLELTAEQSQNTRENQIAIFQADKSSCALIVPLAVGGVAIDLSSADVNIFVEQDWIPATNYQASMRVFMPGRPHSNVWMSADVPTERRLLEVLEVNEGCATALALGYDEIAKRVLDGAR